MRTNVLLNRGFLCCLAFTLILSAFPVSAEVIFRGLDLSEDSRLLFRADSQSSGALPQNTLFMSRLTDLALLQLTAFPEKMDLLDGGRLLQVRNAFGAVRIPVSGGLPRNIAGFPSFAAGSPASGGRVEEIAASADGHWVLYVDPLSPAYGNLILLEVNSGIKQVIARNVDRPDRQFPACWSPDSRVFVYSRDGRLYYYPVNLPSAASIDERYRLIGDGAIASVSWGRAGDFFYLRGSTVYRVRGSELFARAVYADFLEIGAVAGKVPFDFDPNFDSFWIAPDSKSLLLSKGGRNIFYYPLDAAEAESVLPYVMIPRSAFNINVLWPPTGLVTVTASVVKKGGGTEALAWRLVSSPKNGAGGDLVFVPLDNPVGSHASLSPDGTRALFWGDGGIVLYDYLNWRPLQTVSARPAFSCLWLNNGEFVTGDDLRIERVRLSGQKSLICLSTAAEYGFEEKGNRIFIKNNGSWFVSDGRSPWAEIAKAGTAKAEAAQAGTAIPPVRKPSLVSGRYRVYLERQISGPYENIPMIRNTASVGTVPLLPGTRLRGGSRGWETAVPSQNISLAGKSAEAGPGPAGIFTHGLRQGLREVAVCFDLYDDATGLPQILDALNRFGVRATFFLNGEFIRRYPAAVRDIADAGHEAASLFFAPIDLSDARYRVGTDFITRGLARNEDEFYQASGSEIDLLWHAPYFNASSENAAAALKAGYLTVGRDVDPMDWVSRDEAKRLGINQYSAGDMIERIMAQKQPGSIIPVRLGLLPGGRSDYLFLRIDVLLDALVRSGYSVVPVSTIIEHAR